MARQGLTETEKKIDRYLRAGHVSINDVVSYEINKRVGNWTELRLTLHVDDAKFDAPESNTETRNGITRSKAAWAEADVRKAARVAGVPAGTPIVAVGMTPTVEYLAQQQADKIINQWRAEHYMTEREQAEKVALLARVGILEYRLRVAYSLLRTAGVDTSALDDEAREGTLGNYDRVTADGKIIPRNTSRLVACVRCGPLGPLAKYHPNGSVTHIDFESKWP